MKTVVAALVTCALLLFSAASRVEASSLDLTSGGWGIRDGAVFATDAVHSGTGVFDPFVQIQMKGTESAYNTRVNGVNDNKSSNNWNHEITLSELLTYTDTAGDYGSAGAIYYQFLLDINEPNGGGKSYLSLDDIILKTSTVPNQSVAGPPVGTTHFDLSSGNDVLLDYAFIGHGSGRSDLKFLVPIGIFAGALPSDYVYLYSSFGALDGLNDRGYGSAAGFEEWALSGDICDAAVCFPTTTTDTTSTDTTSTDATPSTSVATTTSITNTGKAVPEPASLTLLGAGLVAAARRLRRRKA